jgi:hypothetical protein
VSAVVVIVVEAAVGCGVLCELVYGAVSSVSESVVVVSLGGNVVRVAVLMFGVVVLNAIITAFTAAILAFKLDVFLHHFFWLCLPSLGLGILSVETEGSYRLVLGSVWLMDWMTAMLRFCDCNWVLELGTRELGTEKQS